MWPSTIKIGKPTQKEVKQLTMTTIIVFKKQSSRNLLKLDNVVMQPIDKLREKKICSLASSQTFKSPSFLKSGIKYVSTPSAAPSIKKDKIENI